MQFKKLRFYLLAAMLISASACENVLDVEPEDRVDLDVLYETPNDAEAGLVGVYFDVFRQFLQNMMFNASLSGGEYYDAQRGRANRPVGFRPVLRIDNDGGVSTDWRIAYEAIQRANLLIEKVEEIPDALFDTGTLPDNTRKEEIIGEARFLRAYLYYLLVLNWGDVPLVTSFPTTSDPGANNIPRTPTDEVWAQINDDLLFAEANLPWNHNNIEEFTADENQGALRNSKGRATRGAAKMMLAKIHLMNQEWQQAAEKANEVINSEEFELVDRWTDIFYNLGGQNTVESIWEVQTERGAFNNTGGYFFRTESSSRTSATFKAFSLFEGDASDPKDVRQGYSMSPRSDDPENFITALKFYNRGGGFGTPDPFNFVLLRLGEAYLIRAEALNEIQYGGQEALDKINALRARAEQDFDGVTYSGIEPADYSQYPDQESFRQFIRDERWRELMFEGHQWYDLLRYDSYDNGERAVSSVFLDDPSIPGADPRKILLPIPDREIRVNPLLEQNPGY